MAKKHTGFVGVKGGTKFNWNKSKLKQLVGEAAAQALQKAGLEVRRITQRGIAGGSTPSSGRTGRKNPVFRIYGEKDGYPVVGAITQVPREDKLSTWAPKSFLRNDIQSDWDAGTKSVVVGPSKVPWLNQLHEFGGTRTYWVSIGKNPTPFYNGKKLKRSLMRKGPKGWGAYVGYVIDRPRAFKIGQRTIPERNFMENGVQASMHKIPEQFRDMINGPHLI
jgi:hypothetical protein